MGTKSRNKGKRGEREAAKELTRVLKIKARRGRQFSGSADSPDVVTSLPGLHVEVKRAESFQVYKAMRQACDDAGDKLPIVMHKRNRRKWLLVVELDNVPRLLEMLKEVKDG